MGIDLGLARITTLLAKLGNPHYSANFIHVAGTNGKGSVCAYLSSLLLANTQNYKIGKFTSPHLIYRSDSITLNNIPVSPSKFADAEKDVLDVDQKFNIGATEFELLTATALYLFQLEKVDLAVMEVGLGGRLDATNILPAAEIRDDKIMKRGVLVTGITKIGIDHEGLLGSTLEAIAYQKAGIVKHKIPVVIDGSNDPKVLDVLLKEAVEKNSQSHIVLSDSNIIQTRFGIVNRDDSPLKGDYQLQNLSLSLKIFEVLFPFLQTTYPDKMNVSLPNIIKGIQETQWPGRLQSLDLKYSKHQPTIPVLLDGAHNGQAAKELHEYLKKTYGESPITFVIAMTRGKDVDSVFGQLIKPIDQVIITEFSDVDGMPWIKCTDVEHLRDSLLRYTSDIEIEKNLPKVFEGSKNFNDNIVICGSLYLVGDVLRLHSANAE